ncbi:MAG TPA: hypothetical protein VGX50_19705, partial [Longimicrobium sp.]|nr:hypothetical protein [Longimicrobium sp.]
MTALIVAVLTAAGCDAADAPLEASGAEQAAAAVQRHDRPGIDGEFARLAREIPGFAGYYFDASGDLVVALTDPRQEGAARAALAGVARGRPAVPGREAAAPSQIRVRGAEYGFAQLSAWHGAFAGLHGVPGGRFIDTDEVANRVRVGVESEEAARMVRQEAARLGIPAGAVIVEVA